MKMFLRRGCTMYILSTCTTVARFQHRFKPKATKKFCQFLGKFCGFSKKFLPEFLHLTYLAHEKHCRHVTRPVVNDMFRKLNFSSPSLTFSFSPHLIFFLSDIWNVGQKFLSLGNSAMYTFNYCTVYTCIANRCRSFKEIGLSRLSWSG